MRLRVTTGGESHGKGIVCLIEGFPAGVPFPRDRIDRELRRRQGGYGRGGRMEIEQDRVEALSGVYRGETLGTPLTLWVENKDWANWKEQFQDSGTENERKVTLPRPGHADLAGALKFGFRDCRKVLERSSARKTAGRVAAAALCRFLLNEFGIEVTSRVVRIGGAEDGTEPPQPQTWRERADDSPVRALDPQASEEMEEEIDRAREEGDSLGGVFELAAFGLLPGLGNYAHRREKLDAKLSGALMGIPAIKGVEIGAGFRAAEKRGSQVHDEIFHSAEKGFYRETNRAGGLEGGVTNGAPLLLRAAMKPIPTLMKPLRSVDLETGEVKEATKERADVCAVPAASIVGEAEVAVVLTEALLDKFGGDSLREIRGAYERYRKELENWFE